MTANNPDTKVSVIRTTKGKLPSLPFDEFKNAILGEKYELSIVFVDEKKIHKLNIDYRKMDEPTDILSFSLSKSAGEIFICEEIAKVKAKEFERTNDNFLQFLLIHGMAHLKGYDHGTKMETLEKKFRKIFKV